MNQSPGLPLSAKTLNDEPVYNVRAVAQQTGLSPATLRAWERRYGFPTPQRTTSGYRLYSNRDIHLLRWLKTQIEDQGLAISQAVALLNSLREAGHDPTTLPPAPHAEPTLPTNAHFEEIAAKLYEAMTRFDEPAATQIFNYAFATHPVEAVCLHVFQPALYQIGDSWQNGQTSIEVEHFATNLMRQRLLALLHAAPPAHHNACIVAACLPGEWHEIGLLMLSLFLRRAGWPVMYLGQNMPVARIVEVARDLQAGALLLSASTLLTAASLLDVQESLELATWPAGKHRPLTIYGGRVFNALPELRARLPGLFAGNDAQTTIATLTAALITPYPALRPVPPPVAHARTLAHAWHALQSEAGTLSARVDETMRAAMPTAHYEALFPQISHATPLVLQLLITALRFDHPSALREIADWAANALPTRGVPLPLLETYLHIFANVISATLSPPDTDVILPCLHELTDALLHTAPVMASTA